MRLGRFWIAAALSLALSAAVGVPARAYQTEVIFQHKHWKVDIHGWEDGRMGCRAIVGDDAESFAIWVFNDSSFQLQFYSTSWAFGEGQTADLQVQVDTRPRWDLTAASLSQNSVTFGLPNSDAAIDFVMEIAKGNKLFLRSKEGKDVQSYSLAGSKASINSLVECGNILTQPKTQPGAAPEAEKPKNPFN